MEFMKIDIIVTRLQQAYALEFGGKPGGRYKISYERLKQLSGMIILDEKFLADLNHHCLQVGIYLINLGHEFAVIETSILSGYRNVPQGVIEKILKTAK